MLAVDGLKPLSPIAFTQMEDASVKEWFPTFYHKAILPMLTLTILLSYHARPSKAEHPPEEFTKFQMTYLSVWSLCVAADWLQGPYVYALYQAYGFEHYQVAQLFVAGFAASLFFSCFVGSVADKIGRKRCCMAYCVFYILSCATKHFKSYHILMLGRVTGGIATSLLFSCFECWMVSEHLTRHEFSDSLLSYLFGIKFQVMYFVAIASGILAQFASDSFRFAPITKDSLVYVGGNCVPFDLSAFVLVIAFILIGLFWEENYGNPDSSSSSSSIRKIAENVKQAATMMLMDGKTLMLCIIVSCFEGAMYAFVFSWTPALETSNAAPPFGLVFALFMMACASGAACSTLVSERFDPLRRLAVVFVVSLVMFLVAAKTASVAGWLNLCFLAFMVFEFCVGAYFPAAGLLKSKLVPEQIRGTMYNLFRVPLNAIVVSLLLSDFDMLTTFGICASMLCVGLLATGCMRRDDEPIETLVDPEKKL
mmetsp:Transcript_83595/g.147850  ORF Transcript_83595/g.147850 Transcript_83595/m.147850 type:complete len:480 (+) Transcript_83595:86-1525(+)